MKTSFRLVFVRAHFFFALVWNDHDENNSNVGNLISGAVNLHMHTMPRKKPKVNDSKWNRMNKRRKKNNSAPIVNENRANNNNCNNGAKHRVNARERKRERERERENGKEQQNEWRNNSSSMQTICLLVVYLMSVLFNF